MTISHSGLLFWPPCTGTLKSRDLTSRDLTTRHHVPFADFAFPVCYALMSKKTTELYVKVFQRSTKAGAAIHTDVCDGGL